MPCVVVHVPFDEVYLRESSITPVYGLKAVLVHCYDHMHCVVVHMPFDEDFLWEMQKKPPPMKGLEADFM